MAGRVDHHGEGMVATIAGGVHRLGREALHVRGRTPEIRARLLHRGDQGLRATAVDDGVGSAGTDHVGQRQQALLVLRPDRGADLLEPVAVGHRGSRAAAVEEAPGRVALQHLTQHRNKRCDTNTAGDEQVIGSRHQREVVAWPAGAHPITRMEAVVHIRRAATAGRLAQHRDAPRLIPVAAAQRVLALDVVAQVQVDVRSGLPRRQRGTGRILQPQRHHAHRFVDPFGDNQVAVLLEGHGQTVTAPSVETTVTVPDVPSTITSMPSTSCVVPVVTDRTLGMPSSRLTTTA